MGNPTHITTRELVRIVELVKQYYHLRFRLSHRPQSEKSGLQRQRNERIRRLHHYFKPSRRPWAAAEAAGVLTEIYHEILSLTGLPDVGQRTQRLEQGRETLKKQLARAKQETASREEQIEELEEKLARQPRSATVTLPEQRIVVRSPVQQEIIRLMGAEGLGRSWRIIDRVIQTDATDNPNSVRNSLRRLRRKKKLIDYYRRRERPVFWKPTTGGNRQLLVLTEKGKAFYREAFGDAEAVESELISATIQHQSVEHGVGILEARDHLRAAGHRVDPDPAPLLVDEDDPWHSRAQPDLTVTMDGWRWPVEVQREVSPRLLEKWAKALRLAGRLALILFNETHAGRQVAILEEAIEAGELPAGEIRLTSLEAMETGKWRWRELHSPIHR